MPVFYPLWFWSHMFNVKLIFWRIIYLSPLKSIFSLEQSQKEYTRVQPIIPFWIRGEKHQRSTKYVGPLWRMWIIYLACKGDSIWRRTHLSLTWTCTFIAGIPFSNQLLVALLCLNSYKPHKEFQVQRAVVLNTTTFHHQDPTDSAVCFMGHKYKTKHANISASDRIILYCCLVEFCYLLSFSILWYASIC